jgi:hypothetical protein
MSFIAKLEPKEYELHPKGTFPIICCDLEQPPAKEYPKRDKKTGKPIAGVDVVEQMRILFLSGGPTMKDGRPFMLRYQRDFKLYPQSKFRLFLESWKGEDLDKDDLARGFDLEKWAIGRCGMATVEHNVDDNSRTWANIKTITPLPFGSEAQEPLLRNLLVGYVRMKDREKRPDQVMAEQAKQMLDGQEVPF